VNSESILRIDMTRLQARREEVPPGDLLLGGRALTATLIRREIPPTCHPLAADNKLFCAPGLLAGTAATTSGRTSFGAKSPLTGGTKEANVGGRLGHKLARLGIKAIIVEGAPSADQQYVLQIDKGGVRFADASSLRGKGNYELHALLVPSGKSQCAVTIGPAGERRLAGASIAVTDPEGRPSRHAARGGLGAVMGAKGLKAIVVDDAGTERTSLSVAPDAFRIRATAFAKAVLEDPRTVNMSTYGTAGVIKFVNRDVVQSMPTRNHRLGTFAGANRLSGQRIAELAPERGSKLLNCMPGCVIKCAHLFNDAHGKHVTSALEFETLSLLGSNLEIGDLDAIAEMDRLCDDIGLDTIETGNAFGIAMEAGIVSWGDWKGAVGLLEEIRAGTYLGRIVGNGTETVARVFGVARVPTVKGQGLPAWEPRTLRGMGITYASSPQGADHTAGLVTARNVTDETLLKLSRHEQLVMAAVDSVGLCQFSNPLPEDMAGLVNAHLGLQWTPEDVLELGRRTIQAEIEFNRAAGLDRADNRLPAFVHTEPLNLPDGPRVFDIPYEAIDRLWEF
jgi:aldehyde:ferredoxin oxidoreductase